MKTFETSEKNINPSLLTRWYCNSFKDCLSALKDIAKKYNYVVVNVNENYGEILVESIDFTTIVKITSINPRNTAIDLCVSANRLFKKPIKQIDLWFQEFNNNLTFLKTGTQ